MMKMTPKTTMQKGLLKRPLLRQMFFFRRQKRRDRLFCPKIVCMRRFCAKHNASHAQIIANAAQQMPQRMVLYLSKKLPLEFAAIFLCVSFLINALAATYALITFTLMAFGAISCTINDFCFGLSPPR